MIGSIVRYLFAPDEPAEVLDALASPQTKIVSLTITEGGYNFNQVTGEFDTDNPAVSADLAAGSAPGTVFGFVVEALRRRRDLGVPPFTVMSSTTSGATETSPARCSRPSPTSGSDLGAWMRTEVAFPNSMVDRITPVTTSRTSISCAASSGSATPCRRLRALHPVGAAGRVPERPPALGAGRRAPGRTTWCLTS